jgi:hypothetical protein
MGGAGSGGASGPGGPNIGGLIVQGIGLGTGFADEHAQLLAAQHQINTTAAQNAWLHSQSVAGRGTDAAIQGVLQGYLSNRQAEADAAAAALEERARQRASAVAAAEQQAQADAVALAERETQARIDAARREATQAAQQAILALQTQQFQASQPSALASMFGLGGLSSNTKIALSIAGAAAIGLALYVALGDTPPAPARRPASGKRSSRATPGRR